MKKAPFYIVLLLLAISCKLSESHQSREVGLKEGERLYSEALDEDDSSHRELLFRESALRFEEASLHFPYSSDLYFNLGNAWYGAGDRGRAVLNQKKALAINPFHKNAKYNLNLIGVNMVQSGSLYFVWASRILLPVLLIGGLFSLWVAVAYLLFKREVFKVVKKWLLIGGLSLALFLSYALLLSYYEKRPYGVVIRETEPYTGDSFAFETIESMKLMPGRIFRVVENRQEWFLIEVEGSRFWVSSNSVELVLFD